MAFTYEQIFTDNITFSNPIESVQLIADDVVVPVLDHIAALEASWNADASLNKADISVMLSREAWLREYIEDIQPYMVHTDAITGITPGNANGGPTFNDYLRASAAIQTANDLPAVLGSNYSRVQALKAFDVMDLFESISEQFETRANNAYTSCTNIFNSAAYSDARNNWSNTDQSRVNAYVAQLTEITNAIGDMLAGVSLEQLVQNEVDLYNQTEEAQEELGRAGIMYAGQQDPALTAITNRLTGQ